MNGMMKMYSSIVFFKKALPPPPYVFTSRLYEIEWEAYGHGGYRKVQ
jgi:hypothetical protein